MPSAFKQFGAKGTGWFKNLFQLSLWKLTIFYTAILALILFVSSSFIYGAFSRRLTHRFNVSRLPGIEIIRVTPPPPTADDVRTDLIWSIVAVNSLLLIIAAILSYFLAKMTIRPLEEMDEKQKRFFGDASHELRTPLSILKIDLENGLAQNNLSDKERSRLTSHLEEVDRMSKLVNNLLLLSRFDEHSSTQTKNFSLVNINLLAKKITDHLQPLATHHQINLALSDTTAEPLLIRSNEDMLSQALTNVIKNGIIYNKPQGSVTVRIAKQDNSATIIVTDTGIGMTTAETSHVFDRFYRVDTSRSRQTGGSGLGLSIARSSLEYVGGSIEIESAPERGTTIVLRLPRN